MTGRGWSARRSRRLELKKTKQSRNYLEKTREDDPKDSIENESDDKTQDIAVEIKSSKLEKIVNAAFLEGIYLVTPATPAK